MSDSETPRVLDSGPPPSMISSSFGYICKDSSYNFFWITNRCSLSLTAKAAWAVAGLRPRACLAAESSAPRVGSCIAGVTDEETEAGGASRASHESKKQGWVPTSPRSPSFSALCQFRARRHGSLRGLRAPTQQGSSHPPGLLAHPILLQPTAGPPSPVMTNIRISLRTSAPGGSNTPAHREIITCHPEAQEDDRPHDT